MYVHEIYFAGNRTQVIHAEEVVRPSGLIVLRRLGVIHVAHSTPQSTVLHLPTPDLREIKPEDFKEPSEMPNVRLTADTLQAFRDTGKQQIPKVVLGLGEVAQTGFLLHGEELADGTPVPTATETEINAMREIFKSLSAVLANQLGTSDTRTNEGTGFYL